MRKQIVVNCEKLPFENTLGVAGFLLQLCSALSDDNDIIFAMKDIAALETAPTRPLIEGMCSGIVSLAEARAGALSREAIELAPHHFQLPNICDRSVLICHDLHVFDIGWKYKNVESVRAGFRNNLTRATVVMTEFPRTFYDIERVAGISLMNLYLTESPLLLDTQVVMGKGRAAAEPFLLYPAQLQAHKNHEALIKAASTLKQEGQPVRIVCSGSDFSADITDKLKQLVADRGLQELIIFPGRISDEELIALYRDCAGVIIPSMAEGGAYVAFEGIAAGKPVAVNDIASARQHLKMVHGEAIWFDSASETSTLQAIREILDVAATDLPALNETARRRIGEMSWARVARQFQTVFDWLAGERDRPTMCVDADGWNIDYK